MTGQTPAEPDYRGLAVELQANRAYLTRNTDLSPLDRDAEALRRLLTGAGTQFVTRAEHERTIQIHRANAAETLEQAKQRLNAEIARADETLAEHAHELAERLAERGWPTSVSGRYRREGWGAAVAALERIARDGDR